MPSVLVASNRTNVTSHPKAGYPAEDFLSGAVDLRELRSLGFSARELRESLGPTAARELRAAGFTATQLKLADFDAWQLEEDSLGVYIKPTTPA